MFGEGRAAMDDAMAGAGETVAMPSLPEPVEQMGEGRAVVADGAGGSKSEGLSLGIFRFQAWCGADAGNLTSEQ